MKVKLQPLSPRAHRIAERFGVVVELVSEETEGIIVSATNATGSYYGWLYPMDANWVILKEKKRKKNS